VATDIIAEALEHDCEYIAFENLKHIRGEASAAKCIARDANTVGYSRVKYFDTPRCRKSSRSYSRQYKNPITV
jgi:hypothetical protein